MSAIETLRTQSAGGYGAQISPAGARSIVAEFDAMKDALAAANERARVAEAELQSSRDTSEALLESRAMIERERDQLRSAVLAGVTATKYWEREHAAAEARASEAEGERDRERESCRWWFARAIEAAALLRDLMDEEWSVCLADADENGDLPMPPHVAELSARVGEFLDRMPDPSDDDSDPPACRTCGDTGLVPEWVGMELTAAEARASALADALRLIACPPEEYADHTAASCRAIAREALQGAAPPVDWRARARDAFTAARESVAWRDDSSYTQAWHQAVDWIEREMMLPDRAGAGEGE